MFTYHYLDFDVTLHETLLISPHRCVPELVPFLTIHGTSQERLRVCASADLVLRGPLGEACSLGPAAW